MTQRTACILGGSGFVGHSIAAELVRKGFQVTIISRHRERHRDLLTLPAVRVINGDIFDYSLLAHELEGKSVVINLVGFLNEDSGWTQKFRVAHIQLAEIVVEACRSAGVPRLLHMSALHATENAPSKYLHTKARAENIVHAAAGKNFKVTSFRPAVIFGPRDSFINRFAGLLDSIPLVLPLACGDCRLQPVFVEDVAKCFVRAIDDYRTYGQRYDLCGPKVYTLKEIVEYIAGLKQKNTRVIPLGPFLSWLQARVLQMVPGKPFSVDNYNSLKTDSVCRQGFPNLFNINPIALKDIAPTYISADYCGSYDDYRCKLRDD